MTLVASSRLAGAAPQWVREQVARGRQQATVVHLGSDAVYLDVGGTCLGILSTAATRVPCAVRTALPSLAVWPGTAGLRHGARAVVGDGRISLGDAQVNVGRVVDRSVPRLTPDAAARATGTLRLERFPVGELPVPALTTLASADPAAAASLLGRGSGLTPLGDDVLAGWLATMYAAGHGGRHRVATEIARLAPTRTTLLSATLLACAARGQVIPEFRQLVAVLNAGGDTSTALARLTGVGHSSGIGLAAGMSLAVTLIRRSSR